MLYGVQWGKHNFIKVAPPVFSYQTKYSEPSYLLSGLEKNAILDHVGLVQVTTIATGLIEEI